MDSTLKSTREKQSLKHELDAKKADFEAKASQELKTIYDEGIKSVERSGILAEAKNVGDKAPDFLLKNAVGEHVSLGDYLEKGPVILTWYRGGWCPYCNLTLHRLQQELPNFRAEGANLLALTPELPDQSLSTSEKHALQFEVLSDTGNKVARCYGIVFKLTPDVACLPRKFRPARAQWRYQQRTASGRYLHHRYRWHHYILVFGCRVPEQGRTVGNHQGAKDIKTIEIKIGLTPGQEPTP